MPGAPGRMALAALLVAILSAFGPSWAGAEGLRLSGYAAVELRGFFDSPAQPGQLEGTQPSLILAPELRYETDDRKHRFTLAPFLRLDGRDDERTHFDLREAFWEVSGSDWSLLVGLNRVFWGVTESRHLVDVVNQDDFVEDIDGEDKLGQQMVELTLLRDWGTLNLFLLPGFRERTFPGREGRLRPPLVIDTDHPVYESGAGQDHVDGAVRYSSFFGDFDLGLAVFHGTGREPRLLPDASGERLQPHYDVVSQFSLDLQYTRGATLWKLEALAREGQGPTFGAAVGGLEYTLFGVGGKAADLGLLFELLQDGRSDDPALAPPTVFDDDVFLGARLALNDVQDTSVLLGGLYDLDDASTALTLEAERRLGSSWRVEVESRLFFDVSAKNPLASFETDDFLTVRLSRFF